MDEKIVNRLPDLPGVYIFKDKKQNVLYVGKANSIRKRVKNHITQSYQIPKEENIIAKVEKIDFIITASESEALILEAYLIKKKKPYYNVNFRDDKTYPWVKITLKDEFPRIFITRRRKEDGSVYLGPYPNVKSLKESIKIARTALGFRSCSRFPKKVCLHYHINLCPAPCAGKILKSEYRRNVIAFIRILLGDVNQVVDDFTKSMDILAKENDFGKAALVRDKLKSLGEVSVLFGDDKGINTFQNLKQKLGLPFLPRIIDAVDVSNIQGTSAAGSIVRFANGEPDKRYYRKFKIERQNIVDDYEMMVEIVIRRYAKALKDREVLPDLLQLDGGKGHLGRVDKALMQKLNLDLPLIAYAKGRDIIYSKYKTEAIKFSDGSSEKNILLKIRDEAHRFAVGYHKYLRSKKMKESVFDDIPGIGKERVRLILKKLQETGKLKDLRAADLKKIKGIGDVLADKIYEYIREEKS